MKRPLAYITAAWLGGDSENAEQACLLYTSECGGFPRSSFVDGSYISRPAQ